MAAIRRAGSLHLAAVAGGRSRSGGVARDGRYSVRYGGWSDPQNLVSGTSGVLFGTLAILGALLVGPLLMFSGGVGVGRDLTRLRFGTPSRLDGSRSASFR